MREMKENTFYISKKTQTIKNMGNIKFPIGI